MTCFGTLAKCSMKFTMSKQRRHFVGTDTEAPARRAGGPVAGTSFVRRCEELSAIHFPIWLLGHTAIRYVRVSYLFGNQGESARASSIRNPNSTIHFFQIAQG